MENIPKRNTLFDCLVVIAKEHGLAIPLNITKAEHFHKNDPTVYEDVVKLASTLGLSITKLRADTSDHLKSPQPILAVLKNNNVIVLRGFEEGEERVRIYDPLAPDGGEILLEYTKFKEFWSGIGYEFCGNLNTLQLPQNEQVKAQGSWLLNQLKPYSKYYWGVLAAGLFVNLFSLVSPFFMMIVLDKVVSHNAWTTLTVLGVAISVVVIFESIFDYLKNIISYSSSKMADIDTESQLYAHFVGLPYNFLKHGRKGIWQKILLEPERIRVFFTNRVLTTGLDLLFVVIFALALLWMNSYLFLITVIATLLQVLLVLFLDPLIRHRVDQARMADSGRDAFLTESIASLDLIKAIGAERWNYRNWQATITHTIETRFRLQSVVNIAKGLSGFLDKFSYILIIWVGAALILKGDITVGVLVAASILSKRISSPMMQLASLINDYHEIRSSIRSIDMIASQPLEQDNSTGSKMPIKLEGNFQFEALTYQYPGNPTFEIYLDLSIKKNSMVAIVGESGSGKSTFTRLLLGLVNPINGLIRVDGQDIRNLDLESYRNQIGTVLQEVTLMRGTVRDNIALGLPGMPLSDVVEAAKLSGADAFIQRLPDGYNTLLEESASNLSGGQRQRISLARALLRKPKVLVFDEATSSLDPDTERQILQSLQMIRKNRTVIIVTHRITAVEGVDLILFMDAGKVVASGTHQQLMENYPKYRRLWNEQTSRLV